MAYVLPLRSPFLFCAALFWPNSPVVLSRKVSPLGTPPAAATANTYDAVRAVTTPPAASLEQIGSPRCPSGIAHTVDRPSLALWIRCERLRLSRRVPRLYRAGSADQHFLLTLTLKHYPVLPTGFCQARSLARPLASGRVCCASV
jgi:hypothetical protein